MEPHERPSAPPRSSSLSILLVIGLSALFGCHQCGHGGGIGHLGELVGGPCLDNGDCDDFCLEGGRYPNGTCSVECDDDGDCPDGTWCVDHDGGVCLLGCDHDDDCRGGYDCQDLDRRGSPGDVLACRSD
jgi:hypothetical protein